MTIPIDIAIEHVKKFANDIPGVRFIFSDMEKVESWVARKGKDEGFTSELRDRLHSLNESDVLKLSTKTEPLLWVLKGMHKYSLIGVLTSMQQILLLTLSMTTFQML